MFQRLKNVYHFLVAFFGYVFYGFPSKKLIVIGVTGTSGKTTTAYMIYELLRSSGYNVSLLSTIKAVIGGKEFDTGFHVTTPDPHILPAYLKQAVDAGDTHFVLEVSSHGLDQNRAAFIHFSIGVLTNLTHEHLDYHKTFKNYARAKCKLFYQSDKVILPSEGVPEEAKTDLSSFQSKIKTFGLTTGDETQKKWEFHLKFPGNFNVKNALAAATAGVILGISKDAIKKTLENMNYLPGRWEEVKTNKKFRIIIDFAHKPDALEHVLQTAREEVRNTGRIIALFGCASERDVLKRPMMGEISAKLADVTVLTDEDPRFEDPIKIINEIADGCIKAGAVDLSPSESNSIHVKKHVFFKIPSRKEAITFAIQKLGQKGDIILLCGKGHEQSMNYHGKELPWSEHEVVQDALDKRS